MRQLSLEQLVAKGESQTLEFKRSLSLRDKALESLCAMVNSDLALGTVVFGIDPNGNVCGIEPGNLDTAQQSLCLVIRDNLAPKLVATMEIKELSGEQVLVLSGQRDRQVPYHEYKGRAWIREGTTNRMLSLVEKQQLTKRRNQDSHPGPWQCDSCGSWVAMLVSYEFSNEGAKKTYRCGCGGEFWPV